MGGDAPVLKNAAATVPVGTCKPHKAHPTRPVSAFAWYFYKRGRGNHERVVKDNKGLLPADVDPGFSSSGFDNLADA